jgi:hypothetical protein
LSKSRMYRGIVYGKAFVTPSVRLNLMGGNS